MASPQQQGKIIMTIIVTRDGGIITGAAPEAQLLDFWRNLPV